MPRGLGRLLVLPRRSSRQPSEPPPAPAAAVDPDLAPVGPPVLLPHAIIRQVLFEATELAPVWARPRPAPEPAAPPHASVRKRAPKAASKGAGKPAATRRSRQATRPPKLDS